MPALIDVETSDVSHLTVAPLGAQAVQLRELTARIGQLR
jgi:hypothetical protein